jgi:hypothetical protein
MSDAFKNLMAEHRRLAILRALAAPESGGRINDSILHTIVVDAGIASSRDQIKTALHWMSENDLVELESLGSGTLVAEIKQRGLDHVNRNTAVPGVQPVGPRH